MNFIKKIIVICLLIGLNFHQLHGTPQTPPRSRASTLPNTNQTPGTIASDTDNYCKNILEAIEHVDEFANEKDIIAIIATQFRNFFIKIIYDMNNLGGANESFYMARFYVLCYALSMCADSQTNPSDIFDIIYHNSVNEPNFIAFAIRNNTNHTYVLEFCVGQDENALKNNYRYEIRNHPEDNVTVIRIKILLDETRQVDLSKDKNGNYQSPKIREVYRKVYKNKPERPRPHTVIVGIQPLQLFEHYYKHNHQIRDILVNHINSQRDLSTFFDDLYQAIPWMYLSHLEKFYQALFADALIFTGMGKVDSEAHSHEGRIDILLRTHEGSTIIFEFKSNENDWVNAQTAIDQIINRYYASITDHDAELVGVKITPIIADEDKYVVDYQVDVKCAHYRSEAIDVVPTITPQRKKRSRKNESSAKPLPKKRRLF